MNHKILFLFWFFPNHLKIENLFFAPKEYKKRQAEFDPRVADLQK